VVEFLARLSLTSATDAFSLSPAATFLRSGLRFCIRPTSLPVFCCWVRLPKISVCVEACFLVRWLGAVVLSLSLVVQW